jgi:hypothetical protein
MNITITTRFAFFAMAAVMTVAMLAAVNGLAVSDAPDALIARIAAAQPA